MDPQVHGPTLMWDGPYLPVRVKNAGRSGLAHIVQTRYRSDLNGSDQPALSLLTGSPSYSFGMHTTF